jgi:hypothetical protein
MRQSYSAPAALTRDVQKYVPVFQLKQKKASMGFKSLDGADCAFLC